jgi:uncharacterized protein (TIGR00290 family)
VRVGEEAQVSAADSTAVALSWSGGKDSALALWTVRREFGLEPCALITTVTEIYERISMHGVRRELLQRQAQALRLALLEVVIPPACENELYQARMAQAFASPQLRDVDTVAFGDLFLEDIRAYREQRLAAAGKRALFPLWGRDTHALAHEFIEAGFEATIVCLDPNKLDPSFAGRSFDERLLAELPADVDPCGENGEFHTFVHAGPVFERPIACVTGETVERDGFVFSDLIPAMTTSALMPDTPARLLHPSEPEGTECPNLPSLLFGVVKRFIGLADSGGGIRTLGQSPLSEGARVAKVVASRPDQLGRAVEPTANLT